MSPKCQKRPRKRGDIASALSATISSFRGDRMLLEPKDQVKARLGYSPDDADAFALTFAQPVAARDRGNARARGRGGRSRSTIRWRVGSPRIRRRGVQYD